MMRNRILLLILFLTGIRLLGQTITPSVFNSGGSTQTIAFSSQTLIFTDNIGEVIIGSGTTSSVLITNGFLQPDLITVGPVKVYPLVTHVSCMDKGDGSIQMISENVPSGAQITYSWSPSSLCPASDCDRIDSLSAGAFTVFVTVTPTAGPTYTAQYITQIEDQNGPCKLKVYNGVTLSGNNNYFYIENIEEFPDNTVTIFNRWGTKLFSENGYNNSSVKWPKDGNAVTPGTYFYVIEIEGNTKPIKGWLEVFN